MKLGAKELCAWKKSIRRLRHPAYLNADVPFNPIFVRIQFCTQALMHNLAFFQDQKPIGQFAQGFEISVNDQNGQFGALQLSQGVPNFSSDQRRKPFGGLIQKKQGWLRQQGSPDGQHLLLAPRELIAKVCFALGKPWKEVIDITQAPNSVDL